MKSFEHFLEKNIDNQINESSNKQFTNEYRDFVRKYKKLSKHEMNEFKKLELEVMMHLANMVYLIK